MTSVVGTRAELLKRMTEESRVQQINVHNSVGSLIATWANTESLIIALLKDVVGTTGENAEILYFGYNSTRARTKALSALIRENWTGAKKEKALDILKRFNTASKIRNEMAHCEYVIDPEDMCYTGYISGNIDGDDFKKTRTLKPFDKNWLNSMTDTRRRLSDMNQEIIQLLGF